MSPRRTQGAVLIGGAALLFLLVEVGDLRFEWTPLLIGLTYLVAASIGGRRGSYWATACVICGWGLGVVVLAETSLDVATDSGYLLAAGAGAVIAALLGRAGFAVDALGIAACVFAAGAFFALEPRVEALGMASTYAAALAVIGLVRLAGPERG